MENLIILKLHYCLHDLMFQTTFLQSSSGLKLKMRSAFIFKKSRSFRKTQTSLLKVQTLARCLISGYNIFYYVGVSWPKNFNFRYNGSFSHFLFEVLSLN